MAFKLKTSKETKIIEIREDLFRSVSQEKDEKALNNEIHSEDLSKTTKEDKKEHT